MRGLPHIGQRLKKRVALFRITQSRRAGNKAAWGHSPDVPVWRDGDHTTERGGPCRPSKYPDADRKKPSPGWLVETMRTQSTPNSIMAVFFLPAAAGGGQEKEKKKRGRRVAVAVAVRQRATEASFASRKTWERRIVM